MHVDYDNTCRAFILRSRCGPDFVRRDVLYGHMLTTPGLTDEQPVFVPSAYDGDYEDTLFIGVVAISPKDIVRKRIAFGYVENNVFTEFETQYPLEP